MPTGVLVDDPSVGERGAESYELWIRPKVRIIEQVLRRR